MICMGKNLVGSNKSSIFATSKKHYHGKEIRWTGKRMR